MLAELEQELRRRQEQGVTTALVIDEAQCLSMGLLEEVRLLSNIETPGQKLLPLVLAGQPELADQLNLPVAGAAQAARGASMHARPARRDGDGGLRRRPLEDRRRQRPGDLHARRAGDDSPALGRRAAHHQRDLRQRAGQRVRVGGRDDRAQT